MKISRQIKKKYNIKNNGIEPLATHNKLQTQQIAGKIKTTMKPTIEEIKIKFENNLKKLYRELEKQKQNDNS